MTFDLSINHLTIRYHKQLIAQDLSLSIKHGQCVCLLGTTGIGKSSLLHLIANTSAHAMQWNGEITASDHQSLVHRVMLMTQNDNLLPWLNILDNVLLGYRLRNNCSTEIIQQAKATLLQVGLPEKDWIKKPAALSGGMRQRVALVRIFVENKPLWLLDEPFSALDAITRYKMQDLLGHFAQNKTVLLVTHDPLEALRLADQIYILQGSPATLKAMSVPLTPKPRALTSELLTLQARILESMASTLC